MRSTIFFNLIFILLSCEKDEIPVLPHQSGNALTNYVEMGSDYKNQLFFSLENNAVIASNEKTIWDLAFESADTGWHIRLNTSKGMAVSKSTGSFNLVTDTLGCQWAWDTQSGNMDSTAFGNWISFDGFYIIDRGYDQAGIHQGFSKIKISSSSISDYQIQYADLGSSTPISSSIIKDGSSVYTYINLSTGNEIAVAPANTEWDLLFTQYTHIFDGQTPYLVSGVLINPYNTSVSLIDDHSFEEIDFNFASGANYLTQLDAIGYNWKLFDYDAGLYIVDPSKIYLIKTQKGFYYKLHFTDFYNEAGVKGYPEFEYMQL